MIGGLAWQHSPGAAAETRSNMRQICRSSTRCHRFSYWQYVALFMPSYKGRMEHTPSPITPEELAAQKRDFCAFEPRHHG